MAGANIKFGARDCRFRGVRFTSNNKCADTKEFFMDSDRPEAGTGEKGSVGPKSQKVPNSQRPLTDLEKKACTMANFPETCAHKAISAFWRRVRMSGPEQEVFLEGEGVKVLKLKEVEVLMEDGYWSEKARVVHERILIATLLMLYFQSREDQEGEEIREDLRLLIQRLADRYLWLSFPIVRQTRGN